MSEKTPVKVLSRRVGKAGLLIKKSAYFAKLDLNGQEIEVKVPFKIFRHLKSGETVDLPLSQTESGEWELTEDQ